MRLFNGVNGTCKHFTLPHKCTAPLASGPQEPQPQPHQLGEVHLTTTALLTPHHHSSANHTPTVLPTIPPHQSASHTPHHHKSANHATTALPTIPPHYHSCDPSPLLRSRHLRGSRDFTDNNHCGFSFSRNSCMRNLQ